MHRSGGSIARALVPVVALAGCGGQLADATSLDGGSESGSASSSGSTSSSGSGSSGGRIDDTSDGPIFGPSGVCPGGGSTAISGTVYDPADVNPVYNVAVYVPSLPLPLPTLPSGVSCNACSDLYSAPVAAAVTDATGRFTIPNAPNGTNIPLVVQIGKWRMVYTIAEVIACQDNPQPDRALRLPKSHMEGDIPEIAISTGAGDSLECLPLRMGVDPTEYVGGAGGVGRIHIFSAPNGATTSGGTSPDPALTLWDSDADIDLFDIVLLSCEGQETANMNQQVMWDYATGGGRVFASHFHYAWFTSGPFATMVNAPLATWTPGAQPIGNISGNIMTTLPGGAPFPRGVAMNTWLGTVGALTGGELPIANAFHNADVSAANTYSQPWISADSHSPSPGATEYLSLDTPVGTSPESQCGRVVFGDLHDGLGPGVGSDSDYPGLPTGGIVPGGCAMHALTPQEKALEYMVFDLSSCVAVVPTSDLEP